MPVKLTYSVPYVVSKSFVVPHTAPPKRIDTSGISKFWNRNGYKDGVGCYVFATQWGPGFIPWYVGRTNNSFEGEVFQRHKLDHYNAVLKSYSRYRPLMFFVCREPGPGRPELTPYDYLETELIKLCAQVNPQLRNEKKVSQQILLIRGVTEKKRGRKSAETHDFRRMLSLGV